MTRCAPQQHKIIEELQYDEDNAMRELGDGFSGKRTEANSGAGRRAAVYVRYLAYVDSGRSSGTWASKARTVAMTEAEPDLCC